MKCWCVLQYLVPYMWKLELSQISVERGFIHPNVHGLLDVPDHALWLPVHYGETIWDDWMSCSGGVKVYGLWCFKMFFISVSKGPTRFPYVFFCAVNLWAFILVDDPTFCSLLSLSFGAIRSCLMVFVPLKWTWKPCFLQVFLNFPSNLCR